MGQWEWLRLRRQERAVQRELSAEAKRVEARRTDRARNKEERGKGGLQRWGSAARAAGAILETKKREA